MFEVDPRFRQMGQKARKSRNRSRLVQIGGALAVVAALGGAVWVIWRPDLGGLFAWGAPDGSAQLTQIETEFDLVPPITTDTFTNIPGDPLIIPPLESTERATPAPIPMPAEIANSSVSSARGGALSVVRTGLFQRDRTLMARLPATREEFALFQAERSQARLMKVGLDSASAPGMLMIPTDQRAVSSVAFQRPADERALIWQEKLIEVTLPGSLQALLEKHGFSPATATQVSQRIAQIEPGADQLAPGALLALRFRERLAEKQIIQLSLYGPDSYIGSLALSGAGQLVPAADAWADQQLNLPGDDKGAADQDIQQRLLDVIYAAALRDDIPPELIGEALSLMSGIHDLDSFADKDDQLTVLYTRDASAPGGGQILFIGVSGPSGNKPCYVITNPQGQDECFVPDRQTTRPAGGLQLLPPVAGVMTGKFTPPDPDNADPLRGWVSWSAPQGTPVLAAGAGVVTAFLVDPVLGAELTLTHAGGGVSHYRGMGAIAPGLSQGAQVQAGAPIGVVGTPSGQDEPGVSYQLVVDGRATNPVPYMTGGTAVAASDSVEALVVQIIQVESAGNARAKNPLSSAAGLGQFIESTWLRMMRSYRPDLVASLSRADLLNLRFDPDLSRQMVRHLAQENEAFLRGRGHSITAGRLYLAHFLGPAGADKALRADSGQSVAQVMGAAVIGANPFLRGYSIADLTNWAERKMSARKGAATLRVAETPPPPPAVAQYVQALNAVIASAHIRSDATK